jgi:hypothetical protein
LGGGPARTIGGVVDGRWLPVGLVVLLAAVGWVAVLLRKQTYVATARVFIPNPANDTVVVCRGWDETELTRILADFARSYQDRLPSAEPFRVEREGDRFRIRFPTDIPPPMLSFLINYLQYPRDFDLTNRDIAAVGIVTLTDAFPLPSSDYIGKKAHIYVPSNDRRYDEVFVAVASEYFEQRFTNLRWKPVTNGRIPDQVSKLW